MRDKLTFGTDGIEAGPFTYFVLVWHCVTNPRILTEDIFFPSHMIGALALCNSIISSINCVFEGQLLIDPLNGFLVLGVLVHELLEPRSVAVAHI